MKDTSFLKFLLEGDEEAWRFRSVGQPDNDPIIQIEGIGQVKASQAKRHVRSMLADMTKTATNEDVEWKRVKWMLQHSALHAYVDALIKLQQENG